MNPDLTAVTDLIASNLEIAAPLAALIGSWVLYGVLGKKFLGADDDFWPKLRGIILPKLHTVASLSPGLYTTGLTEMNEYAGYVQVDLDELEPGEDPIDPFERQLVQAGYSRNPLSSYKTNPAGDTSDGSWARRYGYVRGTGDILRVLGANRTRIPVDPRWLADMVGRFLQGTGDILALRQVDVTLYCRVYENASIAIIHCHAHDEPNSLNPLTALAHFKGVSQRKKKGVQAFLDDMSAIGVNIHEEDEYPA